MNTIVRGNRPTLAQHIPEIKALCREFDVVRLEVFELPPGDELTLLVTFVKGDGGGDVRRLVEMEARLAAILGREVSLFTVSALRNEWLRNEAWQTRSTLYEAPARYPYAATSAHASSQFGDEPVVLRDQGWDA